MKIVKYKVNFKLHLITIKKSLFTTMLMLSMSLYSQQFSFKQLTDMIMNQSLYERNHISNGNDITNTRTYDNYSYSTKSGTIGSSGDYPKEKGEYNYLIKTVNKQSDFAEGYEKSTKVAYTFYKLRIIEDVENIILGEILPQKESRKLKIHYNRESDYKNIVREINQYCKYVGIEKDKYSDDFIVKYNYNNLLIKLDKSGKNIKIIMGDFPW